MLSRLSLVSSPISDFLMISVACRSRGHRTSRPRRYGAARHLQIPDPQSDPNGSTEANSSSGPRMKGKGIEKKRDVGLSYTETQCRQLYLVTTHRNRSPGDYIGDILHDHVRADPADLQPDLDDLIR